MISDQELFHVSQVADICGVSKETVRRWDNSGRLTSLREKDGIETAQLGASHFLTKPSSFGELCKQLENVLAKALA